jgi:uncharacterized protein YqeY
VSILSELQESVKDALKAGDKERVSALRMIVCELQKEEKQARQTLDEGTELAVLRRELKRREESIEAFRAGGREDLATHEEYAAGIIEGLLPKQMDEAELSGFIDRIIAETGATSLRDMGKVMAAVMAQGGVRIDGKLASRLVKERLSA